jgi:dihydrofolate synthase/folylpolyglutamate synthase
MSHPDTYQQTLDYLYSYVDFSMTRGHRYAAEQFDLGRMRELVSQLGSPEKGYPVIHIAGTKGKGSVAAMCQNALAAAGYRTGLYTSPHLHDYAERIQVDGASIPHQDLVDLVAEHKPVFESVPELTTFEITTALAFLYFQKRAVDVAVLEVGLGGRLDATNVVTPNVAVITSLSYDHTALLGDTLEQIAAEKAGIIKPGVPVVTSPQKKEALTVLERIAAERSAPLLRIGKDVHYESINSSLEGQTLRVWRAQKDGDPVELFIPLLGSHQVENAATAYAALKVFSDAGLPISQAAIREGFRRTSWPGRFEILQRLPPLVIDCAHNRDSAQKVRGALEQYFPGKKAVLVFGASEDKDIDGMFAELAPVTRQVIVTKSYHPRAADTERLVEAAQAHGLPVKAIPDVPIALEEALKIATNSSDEQLVLVTGSIFIAAGVREAWFARKSSQVAA